MTKLTNAWSVKGVSEQARALAKQAAAESGLSLGQWLNQTLVQQAAQKPPVNNHTDLANKIEAESALSSTELQHLISGLDNKLSRLEKRMHNDLTILHRQICRMEDFVQELTHQANPNATEEIAVEADHQKSAAPASVVADNHTNPKPS